MVKRELTTRMRTDLRTDGRPKMFDLLFYDGVGGEDILPY